MALPGYRVSYCSLHLVCCSLGLTVFASVSPTLPPTLRASMASTWSTRGVASPALLHTTTLMCNGRGSEVY